MEDSTAVFSLFVQSCVALFTGALKMRLFEQKNFTLESVLRLTPL